jgi:hypothetical protein
MSTPIERVYAAIYRLVTATACGIAVDRSFATLEADGGFVTPIDEVPDPVDRLFDIRMTDPPEDDGSSGFPLTRFRVGLSLRVRYDIRARQRAEMMVADDTARLINALLAPTWSDGEAPPHPIQTIQPPGRPVLVELLNTSAVAFALMLTVPFTVLYHQT